MADSASFIYPELQILSHYEFDKLTITAEPYGARQFDGALNQSRVEKVAVESTGHTISARVEYRSFWGTRNEKRARKKLEEKLAPVKLETAQALTYYEMALEDALATHATLKIPGKKSDGGVSVYSYYPGSVDVNCVPKAHYQKQTADRVTTDLVTQTGCVATVNFHMTN